MMATLKNRKSDRTKSKSKSVRKRKRGMKSMTTDDLDEMITKLNKSKITKRVTVISTDVKSHNKRSKTPSRQPKMKVSTSNIYYPRSPPTKSTPRRNNHYQSDNESEQIDKLKKDKIELKSQVNELKEEIEILKLKANTSSEHKYIDNNYNNTEELQYKYKYIQNEMLKTKNENEIEIRNVNIKHQKEIESLQSVIEGMKFEQIKFTKELEHKEKLYQQKLAVLETDVKGKEALNKQLKVLQNNVEKQLETQMNLTNEIMEELDETRKKQYVRVPRNNSMVSLKLMNGRANGCCSSWWGKGKYETIHNMEPKAYNTNDFESE